MKKNLAAFAFGCLLALLLGELVLRLYNPLRAHIRKGNLLLPAQQQAIFRNKWNTQLDSVIQYSRNELGFRGPMPEKKNSELTSIICIGGSTTECRFLSDTQTWPHLLQQQLQTTIPDVWINNAGMDGQSTFGHQLLLQEYVGTLRPKFVLFLTGVNDVETDAPVLYDLQQQSQLQRGSVKLFLKILLNKTELGATALQLYGIRLAYKKGLIHQEITFTTLPDTIQNQTDFNSQLRKQQPFVAGYKQRIQQLADSCKAQGITPIFVTQPSLYGTFTDLTTGTEMGNKYLPGNVPVRNNFLQEKILELYNDVLRNLAGEVAVIDLAQKMPKDTRYFYDFIHFNKAGAQKVAALLHEEIRALIQEQ